ncbi:MAG: hydantoinase/oxoprolinase family protein, partial [Anaerolineales bacterium]
MSGQKFILGIDTGGTYTDGVLLDFKSRNVIKKIKILTTKHDLSVGILEALDGLLPKDRNSVALISISTTLATNSIVEGKGRPVALFLLGYDPELVHHFRFSDQFSTDKQFYFQGGHTLTGEEQAPLEINRVLQISQEVKSEIEAIAISGYFSPFNISHEEISAQKIIKETGLPVVTGYQLSSKLNSIQRATTASLNASLLSILTDFINSFESSLNKRGVTAPMMVMHSAGNLLKANEVRSRPVETIHSGPAASAIGAKILAGVENGLMIDIGGTTTDIAIIDQGKLKINEAGATVGKFHTAVRAADIRSIGLGGDSYLSLNTENKLVIGPERVTPLAYLVHKHPDTWQYLESLTNNQFTKRPTIDHFEFWFLLRKPKRPIRNTRALQVLKILEDNGPLPLPLILERLGVLHPMQLDVKTLFQEEIIGRSALTPTDLFHLTGEYSPWHQKASQIAAEKFAMLMKIDIMELITKAKRQIAERIVEEVVSFITGQTVDRLPSYAPINSLGSWLFEENIQPKSKYLSSNITLKMPIIGIGAP